MVSYRVHRSAEYLDQRELQLKGFEKKKGILQKRLQKLKGQA
ncbi:hypothetical protein [Bacillus sp. UNC41MFS5]|nr:hypothetical protein [Bacillus sp. UNC41MFS5]